MLYNPIVLQLPFFVHFQLPPVLNIKLFTMVVSVQQLLEEQETKNNV